MKTISLNTPLTSGADVLVAQRTLSQNLYEDFKPGPVDGQYGERTAAATRRAKLALGYPQKKINGVWDLELFNYLTGKKKLPLTYKATQKLRKTPKISNYADLGKQALAIAVGEIGVVESPADSNNVLYGRWYGMNGQPWCAQFVSWCYVQAGSRAFVKGSRWAYCPYMVNDARRGVNGLVVTTNPLPGDVVLYCWDKSGVAAHVGIFEEWIDKKKGTFSAIEGNTAIGNDSNGGQVMRRQRSTKNVVVFARAVK